MDSLRVVEQIPWIALLYLTFFYSKMNCMGIQPRLYYIIKTARSGIMSRLNEMTRLASSLSREKADSDQHHRLNIEYSASIAMR